MGSASLEAVRSFAQSSSQNLPGKLRLSIILMTRAQARLAEKYAGFSVTTSHQQKGAKHHDDGPLKD